MPRPLAKLRSMLASGAADGAAEVRIGDPLFDDWEPVREFGELEAARAWRQHLEEAGVEAVITSDWPLDAHGRGEILLQVPPGRWSEAEELLGDFD